MLQMRRLSSVMTSCRLSADFSGLPTSEWNRITSPLDASLGTMSPEVSELGRSGSPIGARELGQTQSFEPVLWSEYFNIRDDIELEVGATITDQVKCQCLAVDMRGHGDTSCENEADMSLDSLARDVIKIIFAMYPTEAPPIILVGHSMGGAVAVHVAQKRTIPSLAGLVVIDVVEGSALNSLQGMTTFLKGRPQLFHSLSHAIEWSVRSSQLRNMDSARVSFPGQLKRIETGQTATSELEEGTALVFSYPTFSSSNPTDSASAIATTATVAPAVEDGGSIDTTEVPPVPTLAEVSEEAEADGSTKEVENHTNHTTEHFPKINSGAPSEPGTGTTHSEASTMHDPLHISTVSSLTTGTPQQQQQAKAEYTWRIDLMKTQPFWKDWFTGLSQRFLSIPEPKLLLLAGVDRLDKDLTIGQMQGKFQMHVFPKCGHAVQEDAPDQSFAKCHTRLAAWGWPETLQLLPRCFQHRQQIGTSQPVRAQSQRTPHQQPLNTHPDDSLPGGIQLLLRWWRRLRPLREELADARLRWLRNKEGFDPPVPFLTRYFVRFPFLTGKEFAKWRVTCDQDLGLGYSWAEFVQSPVTAPGSTIVPARMEDVYSSTEANASGGNRVGKGVATVPEGATTEHPFAYTSPPTYAKCGPRPGGKESLSNAVVSALSDKQFKGYGVFRGFLSTRVPDRGDLVRAGFVNVASPESTFFGFLLPHGFFSHTHLIIRYRGDGRNYRLNFLCKQQWDSHWYDAHHFVLYTRGGPYWEVAKIPLSKFFIVSRGTIRTSQSRLPNNDVRLVSITLMDDVDGPFSLELDYIGMYLDPDHRETFAYEQYDRAGIVP